jgi:hypothetical protein
MRVGLQALSQFAYIGVIASGVSFHAQKHAADTEEGSRRAIERLARKIVAIDAFGSGIRTISQCCVARSRHSASIESMHFSISYCDIFAVRSDL